MYVKYNFRNNKSMETMGNSEICTLNLFLRPNKASENVKPMTFNKWM